MSFKVGLSWGQALAHEIYERIEKRTAAKTDSQGEAANEMTPPQNDIQNSVREGEAHE